MEATYNRANAYHHVMRTADGQDTTITWQQSNKYYEDMLSDSRFSDSQRAEVLRNIGESLMSQQEYEAALNAFRESLLLNPADKETKYDYVLTKRIIDQKRKQQQQNEKQDNNDQNNQDNQDNNNQGENQDNQNNQDNQQNEGDQNGDNKKDPQSQDNKPEQPEQQGGDEPKDEQQGDEDGGQTPEPKELNADQERMLNAIQAEEDKTQEKLKEGEKVLVVPGKKNW
jgi:hypothetical protein